MPRFKLRLPSGKQLTSEADAASTYVPLKDQLAKVCDLEDWQDEDFCMLGGEILCGNPAARLQHRKLWEFTQTVRSLQAMGQWHPQARGLSVAAGSERILFYAANHIARMVAVDIYGAGTFVNNEANPSFLDSPESFAPYPYPTEKLKALYMNGCSLSFPDNCFDFSFSLSSLEHFGGIKTALRALREMCRVTKPGGAVIITTECSLNGLATNEVFRPDELERLIAESGLHLYQPVSWKVSDASLECLIDMQRDDLNTTPHVNLKSFSSVFTSICLPLRKPGISASPALNLEEFDALLSNLSSQITPKIEKKRRMWNLRESLRCRWRVLRYGLSEPLRELLNP